MYFSNIDILNNNNNIKDSETLRQGKMFKKKQNKIKIGLVKKDNLLIENFENARDIDSDHMDYDAIIDAKLENDVNSESKNANTVWGESLRTLQNSAVSNNEIQQLDGVRNGFGDVLGVYKNVEKDYINDLHTYVKVTSPSNPYSNKNIRFSNGAIFYVTNSGFAKPYPNIDVFNNVAGNNKCPIDFIDFPYDFQDSYNNMGTIINSDPPLIVGSQMTYNQTCGHEGKAVYVSNTLNTDDNASTSYVGCYANNVNDEYWSSFFGNNEFVDWWWFYYYWGWWDFGNAMSLVNDQAIYTYDTCRQAALDGGYKYFGLQDIDNSTKLAKCAVSNNLSQSQAFGTTNSNCNQKWDGFTYGDSLSNALYEVPDATFVGVYRDNPNRAMYLVNGGSQTYSYATCKQVAIDSGNQFFALQNGTAPGNAQCAVSNDFNQSSEYGEYDVSVVASDGYTYGGAWANAIYDIKGNAGYLGCYRDDSNKRAMTLLNNGSQDYSFYTCQEAAIQNNSSYFALQNGGPYTSQCAVSNSLDESKQYGESSPCIDVNGNNYGTKVGSNNQNNWNGDNWYNGYFSETIPVNALYQISSTGNSSLVGSVGYVTENSVLNPYPDNMIGLTNNYTKIENYDSGGYDIPNAAYGNAEQADCEETCNNDSNCYGYVHHPTEKICWPKTSQMYPRGQRQPNPDLNLYVRNPVVSNGPEGSPESVNNVDSRLWSNYTAGDTLTPDSKLGIAKLYYEFEPYLHEITNYLSSLGDFIIGKNGEMENKRRSVNKQLNIDNVSVKDMLKTYDEIKKRINIDATNMDNILNDSDIVVLEQNYKYLFWSTLAVGTVLISMNVLKK